MSTEDQIAQNDEMEVLESIYGKEFQILESLEGEINVFQIELRRRSTEFIFQCHLPSTYPSRDPPMIHFIRTLLSDHQKKLAVDHLHEIYQRSIGQVCLYEWIEYIREEFLPNIEDSPPASKKTLTLATRETQKFSNGSNESFSIFCQSIIHGEPFTDRKSTFQAHLAPIKCVDDVKQVLEFLLMDRKIARATHNIMAYRIVDEIVIKDNDDDGEHGAGSKLAHLLEMMNATNVVVVVTRWYGGTLLGPDRFKHINNCARILLENNGFSQRQNHQGSRK